MSWLPYAITSLVALLSAFVSYLVAREKCKTDLDMLEKRLREEHNNDLEILDRKHTQAIDLLKTQSEIKSNEQGVFGFLGGVLKKTLSDSGFEQQLVDAFSQASTENQA